MWDRYDLETGAKIDEHNPQPTQVAPGVYISRNATRADLAARGWLERVPFACPAGKVRIGEPVYTPDWDGLRSVEIYATEPAPPEVFRVTKLTIRRTLRPLGLEAALDAYLAANPQAGHDWDDSQYIMSDDPVLLAALPGVAAATGLTEEQAMDIIRQAAGV